MRLLTWNCEKPRAQWGGPPSQDQHLVTDHKVETLLNRFAPDIAVVPESRREPGFAFGRSSAHAWTGNPAKDWLGVGVYAPAAERLEVLSSTGGAKPGHAIAVRAVLSDRTVDVIAIWAQGPNYPKTVDTILRAHESLLGPDTFVIGDLNWSGQSVNKSLKGEGLAVYLARLENEFGLRSAYHDFHGVAVGDEHDHTLWLNHDRSRPFHCDLILVPRTWRVAQVEVGSFGEWADKSLAIRSDHAPVIADVE